MTDYQINKDIEKLLNEKGRGGVYTPKEIDYLQMYEGDGGKIKEGASSVLALYEYYTPLWVCEWMWELAKAHGYVSGNVIEPSCATGRLFHHAPNQAQCVGFEVSKYSAMIAQITYPKATIYNEYFETAFLQPDKYTKTLPKGKVTWMQQYPFDLAIGNPPYGIYKNMYSSYFDKKLYKQLEIFFIHKALELLKPDGLLVYIISSNFLRNGDKYNVGKEAIGKIATLEDAYRLPKVFRSTDVPTDIIILRKK